MAGKIPAICLEGWTPVASGLYLSVDPTASVPARVLETPARPGIVQVHVGEGSLGATRIVDALSREHVATIARMVQILAPERTGSITRADVGSGLGLPVDLPGRLDLVDPADQRVLPIDDGGRVTDPRSATGVRVLPEKHLVDILATAVARGVVPASYPPMSGQVRFHGHGVEIGLPAVVVDARHGGLAEVRPTGMTTPVRSLAALLVHLDTLRPGERAVIDVTASAGARAATYHVLADPDGLAVLRFSADTAASARLPQLFDAMTITMPGQLGRSAASLATMAAQLPLVDLDDLAACVTGIRNLARDLYGSVRTGQSADDLATLPGRLTRSSDPLPDPFAAVADGQWGAFDSLSTVSQALRGAPEGTRGATVFALVGRPGAIGHAVAFRHTVDGLRAVDFRAGEAGTVRSPETVAAELADARMLLVDGNGSVTEVATAVESASAVRSLLDAGVAGPDGARYAGFFDGKKPRQTDKKPSLTSIVDDIDKMVRQSTYSHRLGQYGRTSEEMRLRYARDKQAELESQTLAHLSLQLFDSINSLRERYDRGTSRDLEVQGMLINGRLLFATNYNTSVELIEDSIRKGRVGSRFKDVLALRSKDLRLPSTTDANEYRGRLDRSDDKIAAAFAGWRASATAAAMRDNPKIMFAEAAQIDNRALKSLLTDPQYRGSVAMLRHGASGDDSLHAEQKLLLAIDAAHLRPDDVQGPFVVMGKFRPCLCCWAALSHYRDSGFRITFNPNFGVYYKESLKSLARYLPHTFREPTGAVGFYPHRLIKWALDQRMSVAALSRQQPPHDAIDNNGLEVNIDAQNAPIRGYNTASDSEVEFEEDGRPSRVARTLDQASNELRHRTLGVNKVQPFVARPPQRVLLDEVRESVRQAYESGDSARYVAAMQAAHDNGANYAEIAEAAGISASQASRLINGRTGHEKRDGRTTAVTKRVASRSGRVEASSVTSTKTGRNFNKRPDLDDFGKETLRQALAQAGLYSSWENQETLQPRKFPNSFSDTLNWAQQIYGRTSIADYLGVPRKTLANHLDKRFEQPNWSATKAGFGASRLDDVDEDMPDVDGSVAESVADTDGGYSFAYEDVEMAADSTSYFDENLGRQVALPPDPLQYSQPSIAGSSSGTYTQGGATYSSLPRNYDDPGQDTANMTQIATDDRDMPIYANASGRQFIYDPQTGSYVYYDEDWQSYPYDRNDPRGAGKGRHLAAPATPLKPLTGKAVTTPMTHADGAVFGTPGSQLVRDLAALRLPAGTFAVLGEGYRAGTGDTVRGGIRSGVDTYVTADAISARIPSGTATADIIACEVVSTGTLRDLFRLRPEMTVVGADSEVFVVPGPGGSTVPAKIFTAETVWVGGRPGLVQTPANQFRAYRPGMLPDAEPEALGHFLPGTGVPTPAEMARAVEAVGAFDRLRTGGARHLGPVDSPMDRIVGALTETSLDDPKPGIKRARPLADVDSLFNHEMRMLLERQIEQGEQLEKSLKNLGKQGYVTSALGDRLHVKKHLLELRRAVHHLHGALESIPGPRIGVQVTPDRQVAKVREAVEDYAQVAEHTAKHMRELVSDAAVKAAVRDDKSRAQKVLEQTVGLFEGALGWTAGVFVPTGLAAAPALVSLGGKGAGMAALTAFEKYQASEFQKQNSSTKALLLADIKPDLMARSIAISYGKGFDLFMAAAGVGGAYVPGWPVVSAGITKIFKGYLDERVTVLTKQIADIRAKAAQQGKGSIQEKEIYVKVGERLWQDLFKELKAKLTDVNTLQQVVNAAKGEPELIGLIGLGSDFAVQLGLGVVLTLFPPKPATRIDGESLRQVIMDVIGNRNPAAAITPSTVPHVVPDEAVPDTVPQTDSQGRQILGYNAAKSGSGPYVKINLHGTRIWGTLTDGRFTPEEPDAGAFVQMERWRDRVIGADHYTETVRDPATGDVAEGVRVAGTWHRPWADKYHFLFVHDEDGTWEWARAFSPTGRMDTDEFNLKAEFDRNPQWLKPFTFEAPKALGVGFEPRRTEPVLDLWSLRQFADNVAWKAAELSRTHGPNIPLRIRVEGGGNGHNALRAGIDRFHGVPEQAVPVGLERAEAVRTPLVAMLQAALDRFAYKHPGQADRLPRAENLVAPASSRGSQLDASRMPHDLLVQDTGIDDDALHRQTRVWFEEPVVSAPGSPASAQSSLGSSFHQSDLDAKPNWLADAQERMPRPQAAPMNLVSDKGALVANGAPPRELLKLADDNPGQVYFWLSTPARQAPTPGQLTELNEVLEQFAQGQSQVTVFTRATVSDALLDVIAPYGGALVNSAPARASGLTVSLDNPWHAQPADRTVPRSQRPEQPSNKIDKQLADAVARMHRNPGIVRADENFGELVWGGLTIREQYDRLRLAPATYLTQGNRELAAGMAERVRPSMRAGIVKPLLDFGAETDVVPRYHESTMQARPKVVISAVYELADAGVRSDVPITARFQSLVEAVGRGATEPTERNQFDFTSALLKAVDLARAGQFTDVSSWVAENKPRLDAAMKGTWVDALGDVVTDLKSVGKGAEANQLERVLAAVYDC